MDPTELNNALQQIGMLSEASVVKDPPRPKGKSAGPPASTSLSSPAHRTTIYSSHSSWIPKGTKRKGKHRKPKATTTTTNTNNKGGGDNDSSDTSCSDDEYFYPPERGVKSIVKHRTANGGDEEGSEDAADEDLQLALQLSSFEFNETSLSEQCKGTTRPHTEGHVWEIITKKDYHPRGIKVRLMTGDTGRVQSICGALPEVPGAIPSNYTNHNNNNNVFKNHANNNQTNKMNNISQPSEPPQVECPVGCGRKFLVSQIDKHLDECLTQQYLADAH